MTEFLIEHQRLLDRLNQATENLRQATRERIRAEDQQDYWRKQIANLTVLLESHKVE